MILAFSEGEIDFMLAVCNEDEYGREFRAQLMAERIKLRHQQPKDYVTVMDIDIDTLWVIDNALFVNNPFSNYTYEQRPLHELADKIWTAIAIHHGYLEEKSDSGDTYKEALSRKGAAEEGAG